MHRALELAFSHPAPHRTPELFASCGREGHRRVPPAPRLHPPRPRRASRPSSSSTSAGGSSRTTCGWRIPGRSRRSASSCRSAPRSTGSTCAASSTDWSCATASSSSPTTRRDAPPSANWELRSLSGRALLRPALQGGVRTAPGGDPPAVPEHRRDHRGDAVRAGHQLRRRPYRCGVEGGRARLRHWRLQAAADGAVRAVRVPAVVPGVRRRLGTGRRRGARSPSGSTPA